MSVGINKLEEGLGRKNSMYLGLQQERPCREEELKVNMIGA